MRLRQHSERDQLELFLAPAGDLTLRDLQDLMAHPFFDTAAPWDSSFTEPKPHSPHFQNQGAAA
jgi:hypothetical protein